jgi:hypothetical protein
MLRLMAFIGIYTLVCITQAQCAEDTRENRLIAAKKLTEILKTEELYEKILFAYSSKAHGDDKKEIEDIVMRSKHNMINDFINIYVKNFSLTELNDITLFYQTPSGKSLIDKQYIISMETTSIMNKYISLFSAQLSRK